MSRLLSVATLLATIGLGISASPSSTRAEPWKAPRTAWGTPDFQGVTWNFGTMTPLERPSRIDKPVHTDAEAAAFERQTADSRTASTNNGYDWWDLGAAHLDRRRTSLIIDPADGHLPPLKVARLSDKK